MTTDHLSPSRLAALEATGLLDSPPEEAYDRLTRIAARVLGVDVVGLSVVGADRHVFKSQVGFPEPVASSREVPLSSSLCLEVVSTGEPLVLSSLAADARFRKHPARTELGIEAYLGVPLTTPGGEHLGTLCAVASHDHPWTQADVDTLSELAAAAITEASLRQALSDVQAEQARKLESLRLFAGGVGHDFNNLLGVIGNAVEFLREETHGEGAAEDCRVIARAAEQAAALSRELLDFARPGLSRGTTVDLAEVVGDVVDLLSRTMGEASVVLQPGPAGLRVGMERSRLERTLTNLVVNARDALVGRPGRVVVATARAVLDEVAAGELGLPGAGVHARLEVRDDGEGMDPETLARCLDPFFTTKASGKGTGLGLATVHSQVRAAGGALAIASVPGAGTTVTLHLPLAAVPAPAADVGGGPVAEESADASDAEAPEAPPAPTVLLVEDEEALRRLTVRILTKGGYSVQAAADIDDALRLARETPPDLLLTDVVMPGLSGHGLAQRLREERPELRVLFMSGYTESVLAQYGVGAPDGGEHDAGAAADQVVTKPFDARGLLDAVHAALALEVAST